MYTSSLAYRMLELTGISGEVSPDTLCKLTSSKSYAEKVITSLKEQHLLKLHYKDKLRGLRLTSKGKKYLLSVNPERFLFYLKGNSDTNQPRSAISRRLRLQQAAVVYQAMLQSDIKVFRDEKPLLFEPGIPPPSSPTFPSFYHSRELKSLGFETIKINNSRAMGILFAPESIYVIYYTGDHILKWDYKIEVKLRILLTHHARNGVLSHLYKTPPPIRALFLGRETNIFYQLMTSTGGNKDRYFHLDQSYDYFHYLSLSQDFKILLIFLYDPAHQKTLMQLLSCDLLPPDLVIRIPHDGITPTGTLILFSYDLDMLRIKRFLAGISLWQRSGNLICFDFQKETLSRLCPASVTITTIDFEKLKRRFFPA